jgi:RNA polymerase sigma-70 factor, ECF subfamily
MTEKGPLYGCMEPTATFGFIASGMESPTTEIQDFDRVMQVYWPRVLRFVMASVRDRDAAETLTQECFWSAYRNRNSFRGDSSLNTWLMQIAVNAVRKSARNRRLQFWRQLQHSAVDPAVIGDWLPDRNISPEASTLVNEQVRAVWAATTSLSDRQRTVFLLRFMEDMNILEIAQTTGLTENAVNVHLFRAVRAVRKSMRKTE